MKIRSWALALFVVTITLNSLLIGMNSSLDSAEQKETQEAVAFTKALKQLDLTTTPIKSFDDCSRGHITQYNVKLDTKNTHYIRDEIQAIRIAKKVEKKNFLRKIFQKESQFIDVIKITRTTQIDNTTALIQTPLSREYFGMLQALALKSKDQAISNT